MNIWRDKFYERILKSEPSIVKCIESQSEHLSKLTLYHLLKLINYSCSSYPTRASYSGQVDGFRDPTKNELKTRPC